MIHHILPVFYLPASWEAAIWRNSGRNSLSVSLAHLLSIYAAAPLPPLQKTKALRVCSPCHIFVSDLPSPVVRTCSFSWAEREILTLSLLYYSKWPSFLLPVFELGSFNPFFYPPSVFNPFLPIPLPPISQMHSYLHLIPVTPLTILWNPIPRPQVQGLASRPQKRSPEARSQQNCLSPIATTAKTPILTGRLPEPELGKSAHPCNTLQHPTNHLMLPFGQGFSLSWGYKNWLSSVQFSSVAHSCPTLCDPMNLRVLSFIKSRW